MIFIIYARGHPKTKRKIKNFYFSNGKRIQLLLLYLSSWQPSDQNIEEYRPADSEISEGIQVTPRIRILTSPGRDIGVKILS